MTDTNLESGQTDGTANSAQTGDKPTSSFDEAKLLERIGSLVETTIEKKLQSQKDRRFDKIEKTLGDFQPVLEKVKDLLTPEQLEKVQRDLEWDEMRRRTGLLPTSQTSQVGNQQAAAVESKSDIAKELGLDENDPEVAAILREGADPLKLAKVAIGRANKPTPSPTGAPGMVTPTAPPVDDQAALAAAYQKEVAGLRGNVFAVSQVQAKYRQKGLKI